MHEHAMITAQVAAIESKLGIEEEEADDGEDEGND